METVEINKNDLERLITLAESLKKENNELNNKVEFYEKLKQETEKRDIKDILKQLEK